MDISPLGAFVVCEQSPPPVHAPITLEVMLPSTGERSVRLRADGEVVRVHEETTAHLGFAAATNFQLEVEKYIDMQ